MTAVTLCWRKATVNVVAMEQSVNCTGHRKKVEVYAENFFTNGSFLQTLDNGVSFHDALAWRYSQEMLIRQYCWTPHIATHNGREDFH